ncbi:unnamed protein product [Didymodactylos carnosus]|uniref:ABC transporter n=1 Tax=Didymodactylos carnosus TaxID=1234261 RepID=A0A8S2D7W4_9BILA|nr:unnamed protein product [Didymodactylos carnosus]CAF3609627.1 unnamed protein product [Didymodactylos carnosus]
MLLAAAATVFQILAPGVISMLFIVKISQKHFTNRQRELGNITGHIEEVYAGQTIVKMFGAEEKERRAFAKINRALYTSERRSQFLSGITIPMMQFFSNFSYVIVFIVGTIMVFDQTISIGTMVAFLIYARLMGQPVAQLGQVASGLQAGGAACGRVFTLLGQKEVLDETNKPQQLVSNSVKGSVEFDHVSFGYDPDRKIINDFSLRVEPGQKVAIVGPTGAGKTTIVNLLMRFYELNGGTIKIDGIPHTDISTANLRDQFAMVLQDTWIFHGTVRENIVYDAGEVSEALIESACRTVGLDHFIHTLDHGYDSILKENSAISVGQRQLVTIARAMVKNAPLLILDEATSSVDTRTEKLIQEAMDRLMHGRTSFIIAHRLSTIKNADLIIVMKDGTIAESGSHEVLLTKNGHYAQMYNSQFSEE